MPIFFGWGAPFSTSLLNFWKTFYAVIALMDPGPPSCKVASLCVKQCEHSSLIPTRSEFLENILRNCSYGPPPPCTLYSFRHLRRTVWAQYIFVT